MTTEFKSWGELSVLEQAQSTYWDMYKDAYGFRPRGIDTSNWSLEDFEEEFVTLGQAIDRAEVQRQEDEAKAIFAFEKRVNDLLDSGASDRATAIRWIHEAEFTNGDNEFLAYELGLPYQYFRQVQPKTVDTI
jgi:hypothetical protein